MGKGLIIRLKEKKDPRVKGCVETRVTGMR